MFWSFAIEISKIVTVRRDRPSSRAASWRALKTSAHSDDSVCLYFKVFTASIGAAWNPFIRLLKLGKISNSIHMMKYRLWRWENMPWAELQVTPVCRQDCEGSWYERWQGAWYDGEAEGAKRALLNPFHLLWIPSPSCFQRCKKTVFTHAREDFLMMLRFCFAVTVAIACNRTREKATVPAR